MIKDFEDIIEEVLKHEGGYVHDKDDPGGETKYGISKNAYPDINIKRLTKKGAIEIYYQDYWIKNKVESVPEALRYIYFDMCINMGKSRAVKVLQEAANNKNLGWSKRVLVIDGGLGPNTKKAISKLEHARVQAFRVKYYVNLIEEKPNLIKFYFGWYRRAIGI
jgi:lysozyme family protein